MRPAHFGHHDHDDEQVGASLVDAVPDLFARAGYFNRAIRCSQE